MKIVNGALVREQNDNDVDDSCFDTSELHHMETELRKKSLVEMFGLNLEQFIIDGILQRHPQTKFPNDISSDQAHMYSLPTGENTAGLLDKTKFWPRTNDPKKRLVSIGFLAQLKGWRWLSNLSLLFQIILFWIPVRWCDGNNPTVRLGFIKLNIGYRHHCGDYRLFKQCLANAPWILRRLVSKSTLKRMTRYYWLGGKWSPNKAMRVEDAKEPNVDWLVDIDDKYVDSL